VALRLRLSANLPFSVERDSAQGLFSAQTVADERPHAHRVKLFRNAKLASRVLFDQRGIDVVRREMRAHLETDFRTRAFLPACVQD
jgi:hypothetical protein